MVCIYEQFINLSTYLLRVENDRILFLNHEQGNHVLLFLRFLHPKQFCFHLILAENSQYYFF